MSLDLQDLVQNVKRAALDAVRASDPMALCFGSVTSTSPLKIAVGQKTILTEAQLILTDAVRDFTLEMTVDHWTESVSHGHAVTGPDGGGTAEPVEHDHPYQGRKRFTVHNALQAGDKAVLLRCDGGQHYLVLTRWEART